MTLGPLFFHISPDGCAEARLARLFRRNGHRAVCHDKGQLAEDILFARATNGDPLTPWQGTVLFPACIATARIGARRWKHGGSSAGWPGAFPRRVSSCPPARPRIGSSTG